MILEGNFKEIGCIVIPPGVNREEFIRVCFNEERFCVMTNTRGLLTHVPCVHQVINDIYFPKDNKELGTQVLVEYLADYKQYIIVGTLSKLHESTYQSEENLNISKVYKGTVKNAFGNQIGMSGNTILSNLAIYAKNICKKAAYLFLECFGNKDSELHINSSGWIFVKSESGIKLRYKDKKEITILDDKIEMVMSKDQKLTLKDKELVYKDGTNTIKVDNKGYTFGNINFKDYITEILDFLGNDIVLLTSMGPTTAGCMASTSAAKLTQLKQKISNINN